MRKPTILLACAAVLAALTPSASTAAAAVALPQLVPSWAVASSRLSSVGRNETVPVEIVLPWRDPAGARAFALAVSDPASPLYRRYLASDEFRARFAPSDATVKAVTSWLRTARLEVGAIPLNKIVIPARGPAAAVEKAFGVTLSRYRVGPLALRAPDRAPTLPSGIAALGALVRGLDEGAALLTTGGPLTTGMLDNVHLAGETSERTLLPQARPSASPPPAIPEAPASQADAAPPNAVLYASPCSAYDGERIDHAAPPYAGKAYPAVACGTSVSALRAAYGVDKLRGVDGAGQTIVMVGSHEIRPLASDIETWSERYGVPKLKPGQFSQFSYPGAYETPADPLQTILRPQVWAVQSAMLFENMRAIAPGANYLYVGSTSSLDLQNAMLLAVDRHWGDVVVNGWYAASEAQVLPSDTAPIDRAAEEAASTGISLLFASGDLGDNAKFNATDTGPTSTVDGGPTVQNIVVTPPHPSVSFPAHNPMVTAVGATSLLLGRSGAYQRELGWAKTTRTYDATAKQWSAPDNGAYRASGGGVSLIYDEPAWQEPIVPEDLAWRNDGTGFGRTVPDVAVNGDAETGMSIGYTMRFPDGTAHYAERRVQADTAATALFGALLALANQRSHVSAGFVNPLLYLIAKAGYRANAFRDIVASGGALKAGTRIDYVDGADAKSGILRRLKTFEQFGTNPPRPGYDTCTGIGSPGSAFFSWVGKLISA